MNRVSKIYGVKDCQVAKLLTDTAGTQVYGSNVDIPGIKSIPVDFEISNFRIRSDNRLAESHSRVESATFTVSHAKLSFDALDVLIGSMTVPSGTTPNQTITSTGHTTRFPLFRLVGVTPAGGVDTVSGDYQLVFPKCVLTGLKGGLAEEDYQIFSFDVLAVPTSAGVVFTHTLRETAGSVITPAPPPSGWGHFAWGHEPWGHPS